MKTWLLLSVLVLALTVIQCGISATMGRVEPGKTCTVVPVRYPDGSLRRKLAPPTPGLDVTATSAHEVRFRWWFRSLPSKCRPSALLLTVVNGDRRYTPYTQDVTVVGRHGVHVIRVPDFYRISDKALGSAVTRRGLRSTVVHVRISR